MFPRLITLVAATTFLTSAVKASGQIVQIVDATNFCVMLPPNSETNRNIADTEWDANAFCLGSTPLAAGADTLPDGFITSAHYVATDTYVQVTGIMDYTKANLNGSDEGGQYDIKAPTGSSCANWLYYVNLIEPVSNTYCIRCCNDTTTCNRGISETGCAHIIPGDYSGPGSATSATTTSSILTTVASSMTSNSVIETTSSSTAITTTTTATTKQSTTTSVLSSTSSSMDVVTEQSVNTASAQTPIIAVTVVTMMLIVSLLA